MCTSGSCGSSMSRCGVRDPSAYRWWMRASRERTSSVIVNAVSRMPSGSRMRSRTTSPRRLPVIPSTTWPAQSMFEPYSQRSPSGRPAPARARRPRPRRGSTSGPSRSRRRRAREARRPCSGRGSRRRRSSARRGSCSCPARGRAVEAIARDRRGPTGRGCRVAGTPPGTPPASRDAATRALPPRPNDSELPLAPALGTLLGAGHRSVDLDAALACRHARFTDS